MVKDLVDQFEGSCSSHSDTSDTSDSEELPAPNKKPNIPLVKNTQTLNLHVTTQNTSIHVSLNDSFDSFSSTPQENIENTVETIGQYTVMPNISSNSNSTKIDETESNNLSIEIYEWLIIISALIIILFCVLLILYIIIFKVRRGHLRGRRRDQHSYVFPVGSFLGEGDPNPDFHRLDQELESVLEFSLPERSSTPRKRAGSLEKEE